MLKGGCVVLLESICCLALFLCPATAAFAGEPACAIRLESEPMGGIFDLHDSASGVLIGTDKGLLLEHAGGVSRVSGDATGEVISFFDTPYGLLLNTTNGLMRFDGKRATRITNAPGFVEQIVEAFGRQYIAGANGLYGYDGERVVRATGADTGGVSHMLPTPKGLLLAAERGLFIFDGAKIARLEGEAVGRVKSLVEDDGGALIVSDQGLFRLKNARVVRLPGPAIKDIEHAFSTAKGVLLSGFSHNYRYEGANVVPVEGADPGSVRDVIDTPQGLLASSYNGLFLFDGARMTPIDPGATRVVTGARSGVLVNSDKGQFLFGAKGMIPLEGDPTGEVSAAFETPDGQFLGADNGLFVLQGTHATRVKGEDTGAISKFHGSAGGVLFSADKGLFRVVAEPLSAAKVTLENFAELNNAPLNAAGVRTRWSVAHPCAKFAELFALRVVATDEKGRDVEEKPASGFEWQGEETRFEAFPPVPTPGSWTFRVISGVERQTLGAPSKPATFVTLGFLGLLQAWWRPIAASSATLLIALNLAVFAAARYSATAWRLATDEAWGKSVLLPQGLLLRHWRGAQLWLLDLYVRGRSHSLAGKTRPFLPVPLTGPDGQISDSDAVLARLPVARHLWVQGGAGMGKTALFQHLQELRLADPKITSFAMFRRDGLILVPIEARRYASESADGEGESSWVTNCVRSVLSESGLALDDKSLLRAILSKGTLGIAIDGLNEVARGKAVAAFAAEFPESPLLVTSQELGEAPFEVWRLPAKISEHVRGLLTLYLGSEAGEVLARRLFDIGLFEHLRSGYDVRLVIDLSKADPEGKALPRDRIGLYRAAVAAAWPEGDGRLELLQAAAWKLVSDRGPNEDKRRLLPDEDAPRDLLEQLEAVRERSSRSIRLIRAAPPGYEFVHDQMNAYLAASWFASRASASVMEKLLESTRAWQDGREAQRTLWGFVAALLDRALLERLWSFAGDDEDRAVLGTALAERARREGWSLTRAPERAPL